MSLLKQSRSDRSTIQNFLTRLLPPPALWIIAALLPITIKTLQKLKSSQLNLWQLFYKISKLTLFISSNPKQFNSVPYLRDAGWKLPQFREEVRQFGIKFYPEAWLVSFCRTSRTTRRASNLQNLKALLVAQCHTVLIHSVAQWKLEKRKLCDTLC